ncbi:sulfite exporter TauE/SafE family protein [Bradyrhizobium sp. KB893862 SZCCT0404]|uniref:sulfite exporter TauE/SafE family protein n=1 Tax=Bradyrhizobium sp. KB893862 SZCCT0404 TaxID=2807672 RepID=UPI001BADA6B5|nr:sulfite exporter TauE/SafE family protein [Bradyrhizobium sp. KB893862 SZCCT0404]MBR1179105.1 sulfite exporter TauE/SafE family protein [Bradyrhizobium sp. KB893862 SZCCT0404]
MDGIAIELPLFFLATFAGAFVAGLSGFAFGLVAASLWLYVLTPLQSASLIVGFGLLVQGYSVWKLRSALDWRRLWPFIVGAVVGVPAGVSVLTWADPKSVRIAVGAILISYSFYAFFRPQLTLAGAVSPAADMAVGFVNGMLGGLTGLAGIIVTIWCNLRGLPKDAQRATFQPVAVVVFAMATLWLGAKGSLTLNTAKLFALGLPFLFAGTWLGLRLFGRIDEAAFRKVALALLFVSGVALLF